MMIVTQIGKIEDKNIVEKMRFKEENGIESGYKNY